MRKYPIGLQDFRGIREDGRPENFILEQNEIMVGREGLEDLYNENINPVTLMFQTGFLTIKHYDIENRIYKLGYPNIEVKESVLTHLMACDF